tara:strand:+ start:1409 stop:1585 length:177 start_codon:yes stop_codon:yes gene_type:complete
MTRTLQDGTVVKELSAPVQLVVYTRCPEKYKLIDMETGQEYAGTRPSQGNLHWKLTSA